MGLHHRRGRLVARGRRNWGERQGATGSKSEQAAWYARWSPDGKQIAYIEGPYKRLGVSPAYVINADGSGKQKLTVPGVDAEISPTFSPDGSQIALLGYVGQLGAPVYVGTIHNGSWARATWRQITPRGRNATVGDFRLAWSPDGNRIAFSCQKLTDIADNICVVNKTTGKVSVMTHGDPVGDEEPGGWSPDGKRFVGSGSYLGLDAVVRHDVFVLGSNGRPKWLHTKGYSSSASWSPDGKLVLYDSTRNNMTNLYVANPDGSGEQIIVNSPGNRRPRTGRGESRYEAGVAQAPTPLPAQPICLTPTRRSKQPRC